MTYEASPERPQFVRSVVRLILCVGAIVAIWLITPTTASALEPSNDLDGAIGDAVSDAVDLVGTTPAEAPEGSTDTVTDAADSVVTSATETVGGQVDAVNDTVGGVGAILNEAAEGPTGTGTPEEEVGRRADTATRVVSSMMRDVARSARRNEVTSVGSSADDVTSTVEGAGVVAGNVVLQLQDAGSAVDLGPLPAAVEGTAESVITLVATASHLVDDGGRAAAEGPEDIKGLRLRDEPTFTIRGPPVTTGPVVAAVAADPGAASTVASRGAPNAPAASAGLPPAMGSPARDFLRDGPSFNDFAAILAAIMIALGLSRRLWREAELRYSPIFLSLAERPG